MAFEFLTNIWLWMGLTFLFLLLWLLTFIFVIVLAKKTHAMVELKAWLGGKPIALFFAENRYCEWKAVKPEAGIITDDKYGAFIINERATYVDKKTKAVLIPFDAAFAGSLNVHAAKLADDLQYIVQDEEEMHKLRHAIATNQIDENQTIDVLKTSVHFGAMKSMLTAMIPHNISAKIEMTIAQRMKNFGKVNAMQILLLFAGMLGAICIGYLIIRLTK